MFKKIKNKILLTLKLLFIGLRSGDDVIFGKKESSSDYGSIIEKQIKGGVFNDLLEKKVTQEVEELRDKHYRVFKESDKYNTSTIQMIMDDNGNISGFDIKRLSKKPEWSYINHVEVYNQENLPIVTIQDNKHYEQKNSLSSQLYDYDTTLELERDGFQPRFEIEKFVKKMVVRERDEKHAFVDLYISNEASQFGKIDAILISNLATMFETKNFRSDIVDFSKIQWISYKAWGIDDICLFVFENPKLCDIQIFDGNFVLIFDCEVIKNGEYIPAKYITKTLDEKYKVKAPKGDTISVEN